MTMTNPNKPEFKIGTTEFSAVDQIVKVNLNGFKFNEGGDIMGRPSISDPDRQETIFMKKGQRLTDVLPYRNNGIEIVNMGELKFMVAPTVHTRNRFACGGYSFSRKETKLLWDAMAHQQ